MASAPKTAARGPSRPRPRPGPRAAETYTWRFRQAEMPSMFYHSPAPRGHRYRPGRVAEVTRAIATLRRRPAEARRRGPCQPLASLQPGSCDSKRASGSAAVRVSPGGHGAAGPAHDQRGFQQDPLSFGGGRGGADPGQQAPGGLHAPTPVDAVPPDTGLADGRWSPCQSPSRSYVGPRIPAAHPPRGGPGSRCCSRGQPEPPRCWASRRRGSTSGGAAPR